MNKRRVLTDKSIASFKPAPAGQRTTIYDALVPGLAVRITDRGHKTFILGARYPGSANFTVRELGEVGAITLTAVRDKAREWLALIKAGKDPREAERAAAAAAQLQMATTFEAVSEEFFKRHLKGKRQARTVEYEFRRELIPVFGPRPITEITRRDVVTLLEKIADRGRTGAHARNIHAHIKILFNWAINRGIYDLETSPCDRIQPKALFGERRIRDRVLDNDELRALWRAADRLGYPYGTLVKFIALTGCRRDEAVGARWGEFGPKLWTVPAERFKQGTAHVVPLTEAMTTLLDGLPRWARGDYVFSFNGALVPMPVCPTPRSSWSRRCCAPGARSVAPKVSTGRNLKPENWTLHDIRRTVRTGLSALRVPEQIAELVIGHAKRAA
jgi:integrase